jgi:hypothetical protein
MKKGGVGEFFFSLWTFLVEMSKSGWVKGYGRYLYPLSQKTSRWLKGIRILQIYVRILRTLGSGDFGLRGIYGRGIVNRILRVNIRVLLNTMSGHSRPLPGHSGFSREFHKKAIYSGRFESYVFVGSLQHNYHVHTCRSKSLLIVRRSYTQFQNKIYSSGKFETPFFIFPFEGSCFVICFA